MSEGVSEWWWFVCSHEAVFASIELPEGSFDVCWSAEVTWLMRLCCPSVGRYIIAVALDSKLTRHSEEWLSQIPVRPLRTTKKGSGVWWCEMLTYPQSIHSAARTDSAAFHIVRAMEDTRKCRGVWGERECVVLCCVGWCCVVCVAFGKPQ